MVLHQNELDFFLGVSVHECDLLSLVSTSLGDPGPDLGGDLTMRERKWKD